MSAYASKFVLAASLALGGLALSAGGASALPALDPGLKAAADSASGVEKTRWVCGPYRCWWRPGPRFYGPRYYRGYGGYGWGHRRWRRW
jgi:hypothetical protein